MSEQRSVSPSSSEAREPGPEPAVQPAAAGPGDDALNPPSQEASEPAVELPRLQRGRKGRRLARPDAAAEEIPVVQRLFRIIGWTMITLVGLSIALGVAAHRLKCSAQAPPSHRTALLKTIDRDKGKSELAGNLDKVTFELTRK
jgi:hypothetical protein